MKPEETISPHLDDEQFRMQLLHDYREYCAAAMRLQQLYQLLDKRHHELTLMVASLEQHFAVLHKKIYQEDKTLRERFKDIVEQVCQAKNGLIPSQSNGFFRW
ncbi:MAG: hypothetical protein ACK4PR_01155 [Gammaproteobacteria bacterium]